MRHINRRCHLLLLSTLSLSPFLAPLTFSRVKACCDFDFDSSICWPECFKLLPKRYTNLSSGQKFKAANTIICHAPMPHTKCWLGNFQEVIREVGANLLTASSVRRKVYQGELTKRLARWISGVSVLIRLHIIIAHTAIVFVAHTGEYPLGVCIENDCSGVSYVWR